MPNLDGPFGFRPVRHKSGGTIRMDEYTIASAYNTNLFYGDNVKTAAAGGKIVERAAAGDTSLGMFAGCSYDDQGGRPKFSRYWPANQVATNIKCWIYTDAAIVFLVQATTAAASNVGDYCDLQVGTGSATTGNSGAEINGTTFAATRTSETFKVLALANSPDNAYGTNANLEVMVIDSELEA